ncbi:arylamine N-acetyltransferase [Acetobacterium sp.]|uniref:arylamine N-acetyltransferase family protein n=1 Tax=Acetobacterium sp. TaxID=1872094 RepID=UPI000CCA9BD6|nr:arylamine N-acetyltransferase [Acetobacterium sp.]MDO9490994.1 arylamine N-acetyltransferase [Acetobacterium sp.]PKM71199.1 MAG: arylamine N-acetyltransferase [Firmicutes bacterium HGW-Firmicutes-17]
MPDKLFNLEDYFKRIHYRGGNQVSAETLKQLHLGHVMNIPFENLDVYAKKNISLELDDLFDKLVRRHRGGYCFEMNGFFAAVLEEMGFPVSSHLARVYHDGFENSGKTHRVLLVAADDQLWVCDVGFGGNSLAAPLLFEVGREQEHLGRIHRVMADPDYGYRVEFKTAAGFEPIYAFTREACCPADYLIANHFTATYPESFFRQAQMCALVTATGKITYFDGHLKITDKTALIETTITGDAAIKDALKSYFGLELS